MTDSITYSQPILDVEYNFVAIIDGLPASDRTTYNVAGELTEYLERQQIPVLHAECGNLIDLKVALRKLEQEADAGRLFYLHFVCHGNIEGLQIGTEFIDWMGLRSHFQRLNEKTGGNIIVNMSSCEGINGAKIVDSTSEQLPFYGLIGPRKKIRFTEAKEVNFRFYSKLVNGESKLVNGEDINQIVKDINPGKGEKVLFCISGEGYKQLKMRHH